MHTRRGATASWRGWIGWLEVVVVFLCIVDCILGSWAAPSVGWALKGSRPSLLPRAVLLSPPPLSCARAPSLRLRGGGEDADEGTEDRDAPRGRLTEKSLGKEGAEGAGGEIDGRVADTHQETSWSVTRSPSPALPADIVPDGAFFSQSHSESSPLTTHSASPNGLLIAMCAWESLHTIAVGGVAPHVTEIAAGLVRRGNEVHLFVRAGHDMSQPSYQLINDVHVHRVPIELNPDFVLECNNMCNAFVWFMRETENHMNVHFDIVHAHDWLTAKALVQMKQAGRRTVFTCHSTECGRAGKSNMEQLDHVSQRVRAIEAEACDLSDRIIAVSGAFCDEVKGQYLAHSRANKDKLRMVHNGIHVEAFQGAIDETQVKGRYGIWGGHPVILFVGRLIPQKGPDILIGALPKLLETNPHVVVVFAGDGHMRHYLEKQAESLQVAHAVRFLGTIWGQPLKDLFKASSVVCVPSRYEPFGIAVLEAWACGKPVVVTKAGGPHEIVVHGKDGLKVNDEASNIAWGLREMLNNPERSSRMGKRGLERCKDFSWDVICARTEAVYKELFPA